MIKIKYKLQTANHKKLVFLICFVVGSLLLGLAANAAWIGSTDDAMTIGGGARPIGMGKAFTAIVDDVDALFINPAGNAGLKGPQSMAMTTNLLNEVYYHEFCGGIPTPNGTFGLGYITTGVTGIPTTPIPTDYYDSLVVASYSAPLSNFFQYQKNVYVGANYKVFNRGYTGGTNEAATGMSADFGIKYIVNPYLSFGLCRQNFWPVSMGGVIRLSAGFEESLASITKAGVAFRPVFQPKLLVAVDSDFPMQTGRPITSHLGLEWKENNNFMVRCGLDQNIDAADNNKTYWDPTFGTSFGFKGFRIDYAYHPYYNYPGIATSYVSLCFTSEPWWALKGKIE